jgi:hypothetical protein
MILLLWICVGDFFWWLFTYIFTLCDSWFGGSSSVSRVQYLITKCVVLCFSIFSILCCFYCLVLFCLLNCDIFVLNLFVHVVFAVSHLLIIISFLSLFSELVSKLFAIFKTWIWLKKMGPCLLYLVWIVYTLHHEIVRVSIKFCLLLPRWYTLRY